MPFPPSQSTTLSGLSFCPQFVDGWELNGEYFPAVMDHHRQLEDRVYEFCNNNKQW